MNHSHREAPEPSNRSILKKVLLRVTFPALILFSSVFIAFRYSPWPSALLIRYSFNKEGARVNYELGKYVPEGVTAMTDLQYDAADGDAFLDVYYPSELTGSDKRVPVIVWIHGGGWVAGSKSDVSNYCRILASRGYAVVSVNYSVAPAKRYPTPVKQIGMALSYLEKNAERFHIDPDRFVLAGDSGGAQMAAQAANVISNDNYSRLLNIAPAIKREQLRGLILYCGHYDAGNINFPRGFSTFITNMLWAYSGKRDFASDPALKSMSVLHYLDANFPPCFISAGNGDPLLEQSKDLAEKLEVLDVKTNTLFYSADYKPSLLHEYQFNLEIEAGRDALEKSVAFLGEITKN